MLILGINEILFKVTHQLESVRFSQYKWIAKRFASIIQLQRFCILSILNPHTFQTVIIIFVSIKWDDKLIQHLHHAPPQGKKSYPSNPPPPPQQLNLSFLSIKKRGGEYGWKQQKQWLRIYVGSLVRDAN